MPSPLTPITVMLVDDSAVVRGIISQALETDGDIKIVASLGDGQMAITKLGSIAPDIIILDVEMPVMDGLTALPEILKRSPNSKVIMCSSLTHSSAETALKALSLGAVDCIGKPSAGVSGSDQFKIDLRLKVLALGRSISEKSVLETPARPALAAPAYVAPARKSDLTLRPIRTNFRPKLLVIGSSTGGPKALPPVLSMLQQFPIPIVITQHMPATFTRILAEQLTKSTGIPCFEAMDGQAIRPGEAYIAPGGLHMTFRNQPDGLHTILSDAPPVNFCRPSVDVMLNSAIDCVGADILAVILTGMGHDGFESCKRLVAAGGVVASQDKNTSVVWGMPAAVAENGLCSEILPLPAIGGWIRKVVRGQ